MSGSDDGGYPGTATGCWMLPQGLERPRMGRCVDPECETRHHLHARRGQLTPELVCHPQPVLRRLAGADDRHPRIQGRELTTADEECRWSILIRSQPLRNEGTRGHADP